MNWLTAFKVTPVKTDMGMFTCCQDEVTPPGRTLVMATWLVFPPVVSSSTVRPLSVAPADLIQNWRVVAAERLMPVTQSRSKPAHQPDGQPRVTSMP